jgi:hypothetical protein
MLIVHEHSPERPAPHRREHRVAGCVGHRLVEALDAAVRIETQKYAGAV